MKPHTIQIVLLFIASAACPTTSIRGQAVIEVTDRLDVRTNSATSPPAPFKLELRATDGVLVGKGTINLSATLPASDLTSGPSFLWIPTKSAFFVGESTGAIAGLGRGAVSFNGGYASGPGSFAMGYVAASGYNSVALGYYCTSVGDYSFTAGTGAYASGWSSVALAQGYSTAMFSVALGGNAIGDYSFSANRGSATSYDSTAFGRNNVGGGSVSSWEPTDPLFEIGMGTSSVEKANAFTVYKSGKITMFRQGDIQMGDFDE